ncbi:beta strand repeat-containing protein, partial [Uliginosibacterium sediminicola]
TLIVPSAASFTDTSANDSFSNDTGSLGGTDRDSGQSLVYGVQGGSVAGGLSTVVGTYGSLSVNTSTGAYIYTPNATAINALTANASESFTLTVSDGNGGTTTTSYTVNLTGANDTPTLIVPSAASFTDTSANDSFSNDTGSLGGTDRDSGQSLVYGVQGGSVAGGVSTVVGTYGSLSVNTSTGAYIYTPNATAINALTANTSESFTLTVSDGNGGTTTTSYTVNLTGANDAPTLIVPSAASFTDTSANDSFSNDTGSLGGTDRDSGQSLVYGVQGGSVAGGLSTVVGTYGSLSVNTSTGAYVYTPNATAINALTANASESFTLTVSDGNGGTTTSYTVNLTGANDAPTLIVPSAASFTDTSANDSFSDVSGSLGGTDRDSGQSLVYGVQGGSVAGGLSTVVGTYGSLSVNTSTGAYVYTPNATAINALTANTSESFTLTVSDGNGGTTTTSYTVNLTGANDTPTLATPTAASFTDTSAADSFSAASGSLGGSERDAGQTLVYGIQGGVVSAGSSTLVGSYGSLSVNTTTGAYVFTPNANAINALKSNTTESFTLTLSDGNGSSTTTNYTVSLAASNDAPIVSLGVQPQSFSGSGSWSFVIPSGAFSDAEGDSLSFSATLADGGALPAWLSFDPATRSFQGNPPNDLSALAVKLTVSDAQGGSVTQNFSLSLSNVNDAPSVANAIANQSFNGSGTISFSVPANTFSDVDGDTLTLSARLADGSALPSWLSFDPVSRSFSGQPPSGSTALNIVVSADDGHGATVTTGFTLDTVAPPPVVVEPAAPSAPVETVPVTVVEPSTPVTPTAEITFLSPVSSGTITPPQLVPVVAPVQSETSSTSSQGQTVPPVQSAASSGLVTFAAGSGLDAGNRAAVLEVTRPDQGQFNFDLGSRVSVTVPQGTFVHSSATAQVSVTAIQQDGQALPSWLSFNPSTGTLEGTPPASAQGEIVVRVIARDQNGRTAETMIKIRIGRNTSQIMGDFLPADADVLSLTLPQAERAPLPIRAGLSEQLKSAGQPRGLSPHLRAVAKAALVASSRV